MGGSYFCTEAARTLGHLMRVYFGISTQSPLCVNMLHMLYVQSLGINEIDVCFTEDDSFIQLQKFTVLLETETCDFKFT